MNDQELGLYLFIIHIMKFVSVCDMNVPLVKVNNL